MVFNLKSMCSLEIPDLDCLTEEVEVEEERKMETNTRIRITSLKSRDQKLAVAEVVKQYLRKALNGGKIKAGNKYECGLYLPSGQASTTCRGSSRKTACRKFGQVGSVFCGDPGGSGESW